MERVPMPTGTSVEADGRRSELLDVSALGAKIESQSSVRPGQCISLAWRRNGCLVETKGVVVWAQAIFSEASLVYRAGVEFIELVSLRDTGYLEEDFGLPS
jgi:hypothetical protein